ncbi:acyl-CoA dehydrogenase family protein [Rhodococcus sp. NCIMB 12038]|uniref:acyl-CoA dehydrogenase family protein n=1 Tax=Rhodococcus sp. NCIMB 12038 TaxID=933800 RepID=UPI000B3CA825|nr:acyl-CoA dehydrogenase family protein [Rhodococcus sp. NCIMB 12038]OUS92842.1 hypothetical protein CA951_26255 [Rhodococcus sp. NCIMB 12038]
MTEISLRPEAATDPQRRADLLSRIDELAPMLAANAVIADQDRKVPEESIKALFEAGAFRLTRPRAFGGYESSARTLYEVIAAIGRHCPASAWVTSLSSASVWAVAHFPATAVEEVFGANPDAQFCGSITLGGEATPVDGGYIVNGSWGFQSGSYYADWAMLGTPIKDEHDEIVDQVFVLVPREELGWKDTWHVAGMRGTGSNTLIAEEVFVPENRIMSLPGTLTHTFPQDLSDNPHYNMPMIPLFNLALVAPQIGMARGALDSVLDSLAQHRGIAFSYYKVAAQASITQTQVAEAASLIDTAEALLLKSAEEIDLFGASAQFMPATDRIRVKMAINRAMECARDAVDRLLNVGGASSFANFNRLQMYWRDIETASRHALLAPAIARESYGRTLLGIDDQSTPFL